MCFFWSIKVDLNVFKIIPVQHTKGIRAGEIREPNSRKLASDGALTNHSRVHTRNSNATSSHTFNKTLKDWRRRRHHAIIIVAITVDTRSSPSPPSCGYWRHHVAVAVLTQLSAPSRSHCHYKATVTKWHLDHVALMQPLQPPCSRLPFSTDLL
jgi:hypothetical protein